jgi:hypothetical protein
MFVVAFGCLLLVQQAMGRARAWTPRPGRARVEAA